MWFWAVAAALIVGSFGVVLWPLLRGERSAARRASHDMQVYRDQLKEIDVELARGVLHADEAEASRTEIARRLLAAADAEAREVPAGAAPRRLSRLLAPALLAGGALAAAGLYSRIGAPGLPDLPLAARLENQAVASAERPTQAAVETMMAGQAPVATIAAEDQALIDRLREVLEARPDDAEGHRLLAGSLAVMGRFAEARAAQERVVTILGEEAAADDLIDLAELMVLAAGGYVSPEAEAALVRGLALEPQNPIGRYYSGLRLLQAGRADLAYPLWAGLLAEGPPDAPWVAAIKPEIEEVARLAGQPGPGERGPTQGDIEAASQLSQDDRAAMIEGMVEQLGARLAEEGGPPEDWAKLIRSLGVLGRTGEAQAIWDEARGTFAEDPAALASIQAAARGGAGVTGSLHDDVEGFAAALPPGRAVMGLDLGTKTIGVAVSDTGRRIATPLQTVRRTRFAGDAAAISGLVEGRSIAGLVIGLPRNMDGSEGTTLPVGARLRP